MPTFILGGVTLGNFTQKNIIKIRFIYFAQLRESAIRRIKTYIVTIFINKVCNIKINNKTYNVIFFNNVDL